MTVTIPESEEPKAEAWLEKRGATFEVSRAKNGRFQMWIDFSPITDAKRREAVQEMFTRWIGKIPGGKILKNQK